jgi:hypothetical protein
MTLPNLDRTDKDSIRWFILLPSGHEGPYSLNHLSQLREKKKLSPLVRVWCEGLADAVSLEAALRFDRDLPAVPPAASADVPAAVPPVPRGIGARDAGAPGPEDLPPPVPVAAATADDGPPPFVPPVGSAVVTIPRTALVLAVGFGAVVLATILTVKGREQFVLRRLPRMTPELHQRILRENVFDGWRRPVFFREYVPRDHSRIWLVTTGFQTCDVEASFTSVPDRLLSLADAKVSFVSRGRLAGHVAELSTFDFRTGAKLVPGLYELDVKAVDCRWDGLLPRLMNFFAGPAPEYLARTRVVLYSEGPLAFHETLGKLLKKKEERIIRENGEAALFWQDLQQKFETLEAVTLQIEQHLLDYLDAAPEALRGRTKGMVDEYTRKYGTFLTSFVVENEGRSRRGVGAAVQANYDLEIRTTTKKIGFETMKFIEEVMALKKAPSKRQQAQLRERVRKIFAPLKKELSQKLVQVSLDQAR